MVNKMSAVDGECGNKNTCDCGRMFSNFLGLYLVVIVIHTVFRIRFYCRAVVRHVTRREIKIEMRRGILIFACIFTIVYSLMLYGWYSDTKRNECDSDTRYIRLK